MNDQNKCTIVMYHYVRDMEKTEYPKIKGLTIKKFINQLNRIIKNYKIIKLEDYLESLKNNKEIPKNSCILTFDDGFKDHYINVFPLLKEKRIPAYFFPITQPLNDSTVPAVHKTHFLLAKIGPKQFSVDFNKILNERYPQLSKEFFVNDKIKKERKYRWDDALTSNLKYSIAALPVEHKTNILNEIFSKYFYDEKKFCEELYMGWKEMKEMVEEGMVFGGHTHTHPMLEKMTKEEQAKEIEKCTDILEKNLNRKMTIFSYPYGNFNEITKEILKEKEYTVGLTTNVGMNIGSNINAFELKRLDTNDLPQE